MSKKSLGIIFGGDSSEHEVSLMSVTSVIQNINREKYEIYLIGITKDGKWLLYKGGEEKIIDGVWDKDENNIPAFISPDPSMRGLVVMDTETYCIELDVVFPVLHGRYGEDGKLQGLLEMAGIPYVGCATTSSACCMDKAITHTLLSAVNIPQSHYLWFFADRYEKARDIIRTKIEARLNFPIFVKPANSGSSVGISKVVNMDQLDAAIAVAAKEDVKIIVEEGISGHEIECAVIGSRQDAKASAIGEISAGAEFYDYDDKYINGVSQSIIPAKIDEEISLKVREMAVRAYRHLGCSGLARVDFFVTDNAEIYLNEVNTMPGFTKISMYPKLWEAMGVGFSELIDMLIDCALEEHMKN